MIDRTALLLTGEIYGRVRRPRVNFVHHFYSNPDAFPRSTPLLFKKILGFMCNQRNFRQRFSSQKIDRLFNEQVLSYAENRYRAANGEQVGRKLTTLNDWWDLIGNLLPSVLSNLRTLADDPGYKNDDPAILTDIKTAYEKLEILEHWLWHHRFSPQILKLIT